MDDFFRDVDVEMTHHFTPAVTRAANTPTKPQHAAFAYSNLHIYASLRPYHRGPLFQCCIQLVPFSCCRKRKEGGGEEMGDSQRFLVVVDEEKKAIE